ncbi:MAG TPA: phenylalanine--tRNA ligase subunit alpha [Gammaproteobacteria bacterium]|nr:phenylalanine--tRNA ligase subunit alpha [Gammaproteobacteria bacterium]
MTDNLSDLSDSAIQEINKTSSSNELELVRVKYLGKRGSITGALKSLSEIDPKDRPAFGKRINEIKSLIQLKLSEKKDSLQKKEINQSIDDKKIDVTLPGRNSFQGHRHPITRTLLEIEEIFYGAGFEVEDGPEIEDEYHNFTALNISDNHPARAMHDTFYFNSEYLLRTHTSPIQIRSMEREGVPIRVIAPGKVYRRDSDITHTPMFHQIEGLVIDKGINFSHLKGILHQFINTFFEDNTEVRFRPSYFPFTEPSAEVDILSKENKWLEILGCGMVHPKVLENLGINTETYSGYAFGMGVERLTMLKYGIKDIRSFYENDLNFLNQF